VQNFVDKAGIPAINELRNVGHHLLRSMNDQGQIVSRAELASAISHSRRACYEASEAGILAALQVIKKFKNDYATVEVGACVPGYPERLAAAAQALRLIEKGRRSREQHTEDFDERMTVFRQLREFCDLLDASRDEMNKRLGGARRDARRFALTALFAALGILLTIWQILKVTS